ncbi:MAG: 16S rRNA (cytosine(967)-C(5))-methyltransferase RsmB, partial [Betaproteobacteria bacterium]|nr:16S rRNA (cytosine(967)-C(5))-methyltransferase RsmB [Betaproteobacteria bacterium]
MQTDLWRQLQSVAALLQAVRGGSSATAALGKLAPEARPGVQALSFTVLRFLGRAQALRQLLASKTPPPAADALLCTALALAWQDEGAPYEAFTLVNQTVEAAKRGASTQAQAGFINACLRRFLREREALVASTQTQLQALWNHPLWWIDRLRQDWPDCWQDILAANNVAAPMTLRVNLRKTSVASFLQTLATAGMPA